ncbi:HFLK protein (hflK) [Rickettsia prowazekii str. GvV257]|uniref:FtsH protease activity modulator HflK n=1 Tax=Rickettsia prowazekii TaxID=782 RepID=UPI000256C4A3|nr:FtsH protease activity modulator HflK [Rickettsia prowazekii]AFE52571.1 HFLK protein (hflK) [Rickettsia prowazekii str. GvV257]AFE53142.1 HFLK protein (hflK) [Rickettsia prowazekii str. RpGvF24]EOB10012.1 Protein mrp [Rickettsia prowazekii str. GvF12]
MLSKKYISILKKSPWKDFDSEKEDNIFTRPRKNQFTFDKLQFPFNFNTKTIILAVGAMVILWLASGIYEIKEGEEAAVIRFGRFVRKGYPGLNYHFPSPFENIIVEKVKQSRRIEIGYRTNSSMRSGGDKNIVSESIMLTGDENIVSLNCDVMWHISNLEDFIFNVQRPEETVKATVESSIREVIGNTPISWVLSDQKQEITYKIEKLAQKILDSYNAGVMIEKVQLLKAEPPSEVIDAYRDVQTSKADKEKEINQAQAYNNKILPEARGTAAKIIQEAEGYREEVISKAEGDSQRFNAIYKQYATGRQVTRDRLYLEVVEEILGGSNKTIINNALLPHMLINR